MKTHIRIPRPGKALLTLTLAALLTAGPTLTTFQTDSGPGMAAAGARGGGGGGARGGGGGARAGGGGGMRSGGGGSRSASRVDRAPRQASANRGSISAANRDVQRTQRPAGTTRPAAQRPEGGARVSQPAKREGTRQAAARPSQKTASQNRAQFNEKLATHERPRAGTSDRLAQAGGLAAAGAGGALAGGALADRGGREGQLGEGREGLQGQRGDRQEGRQGERGERQEGRTAQRDDRQGERGDRQEGRQGERGERQDGRVEQRGDRRADYQENRDARRQNVDERRQDFTERRDDIRQDRQDRMDDIRENRQEFADDWLDQREDLWDDIYDDNDFWGDWDDDWFDDDNWWVWGLAAGVAGYAIGAAVSDPPYGTVAVPYGGTSYQYYGGAFYEPAPSGEGYVTTTAPIGATVAAPPIDCTIVFSPNPDDPGYCYFQGAFFVYDEQQDQYVVADPALGTEVPYLPEGYKEVEIGGKEYLELGGIYYRHYLAGDEEVFVVAKA